MTKVKMIVKLVNHTLAWNLWIHKLQMDAYWEQWLQDERDEEAAAAKK